MKIKQTAVSFLILITLTRCFAPVNLGFENAKLLKKKEFRIAANYSNYYGLVYDDPVSEKDRLFEISHVCYNYGLAINYGIFDKFNLGMRFEQLYNTISEIDILGKKYEYNLKRINYAEISGKINLKENKLSLGIPAGFYFINDKFFSVIDPRLYWTFRGNDKLEFTMTPKVHLLIAGKFGVMPGITIGAGISSDLNKWAIRPEIGYDGCFSFGFSFDYHILTKSE